MNDLLVLITYGSSDGNTFTIVYNKMFDGELPTNIFDLFKTNPSVIKIEIIRNK